MKRGIHTKTNSKLKQKSKQSNGAYGSLFNPRDHKELAYKINDFLENPTKLQQKIHSGRSILTKFTITNTE